MDDSSPEGHAKHASNAGHVYAFEAIDLAELPFLPLAARRALDEAGIKITLPGWLSLTLDDRQALVAAGVADTVDRAVVRHLVGRATPLATVVGAVAPPSVDAPGDDLKRALGDERPLPSDVWRALSPLDRYALAKSAAKPEKLARAYEAIVGARVVTPPVSRPLAAPVSRPHLQPVFAHLDEGGEARMVDVASKPVSARYAVASARVTMKPDVLASIVRGDAPKGDVFAVARIAGIQAAKRTPDLVPLCHGVALTRVDVSFEVDAGGGIVTVRARAEAIDRTGVEMEALVAASLAALTIYDMVKSADRWMTIGDVRLDEKAGGQSGHLLRPSGAAARVEDTASSASSK